MSAELKSRLLALVAPPACVICRASTDPTRVLCSECTRRIAALPPGTDDGRVFAAFTYAGPTRELVAALKFRGATACATAMAELMLPRLPEWALSAAALVPAPANPDRRRLRGFNQSALLAQALASRGCPPPLDCLVRSDHRSPQSELSRAGRLALPSASVRVDTRRLRQAGIDSLAEFPTKVVVCDDVVTTGVTLEVCAQAIRERQPEKGTGPIRAVVFASAGGRG